MVLFSDCYYNQIEDGMGSACSMNRSDAILEAEDSGTDHQRQPLDLTVCFSPLYIEASGVC
jgi:hypothetical protein